MVIYGVLLVIRVAVIIMKHHLTTKLMHIVILLHVHTVFKKNFLYNHNDSWYICSVYSYAEINGLGGYYIYGDLGSSGHHRVIFSVSLIIKQLPKISYEE